MSEFDPDRPARVYESLNDETFDWLPERDAESYRKYADGVQSDGQVNWDGLLLQGWEPLDP